MNFPYTNNAHGKEEIKENVGHVYPLHTNIIQEDLPNNSTGFSLDAIARPPSICTPIHTLQIKFNTFVYITVVNRLF